MKTKKRVFDRGRATRRDLLKEIDRLKRCLQRNRAGRKRAEAALYRSEQYT